MIFIQKHTHPSNDAGKNAPESNHCYTVNKQRGNQQRVKTMMMITMQKVIDTELINL